MSFSSYAHIARYGFMAVIVIPSAVLFVRAARALLANIRRAADPVRGFFLLSSDPVDPETVAPLPLFHTTHIGASRASDIRIRGKGIRRFHLSIFYHNREWIMRPEHHSMVWLNGTQTEESAVLKHGDQIGIGRCVLHFIVDREPVDPLRSAPTDTCGHHHHTAWSGVAVLMTIALQIGAMLIVYFGMRGTDTEPAAVFFVAVLGAVFLFTHLVSAIVNIAVKPADPIVLQAAVILTTIGLLMQARLLGVSRSFPSYLEGYTMEAWHRSLKIALIGQAGAVLLALMALTAVVLLTKKTNLLETIAPVCFVLTPLCYAATIVLGRGSETHGAGLWIPLPGGITIQLTEFAKITWIVTIAWFFRIRPKGKQLVAFGAWGVLNACLIVLLPDLGSIMILFPVTLVVFTVMTSEYLLSLGILGIAGIAGVFLYQAVPYVNRRLYGWISLWDRIGDDNRQIVYGLQAVSRGGLSGRGLGNGSPGGIPLASSDMIFAIVCEELGLIVGIALIFFYMAVWLRGVSGMISARDGFTSAFILGSSTAILIEALVVIGGTTGLIPLTGVTLPFVARGGSSLLAKWLLIALLLGVLARSSTLPFRISQPDLRDEESSKSTTPVNA